MEPRTVHYRPDLDGLRAIAILPVIWFHSGLPGLPGGFTGVDTFFVISGYLITLIVHREVAAGTFSFTHFYERRVRRIAPALLLVLLTSTIAAYALLLPSELVAYSRSAAAALAMISNIYFWRSAGYFALADGITPLLHTWSLGVEEQFYLFFPAVLIAAERIRATRGLVAVAAAASFLLCIIVTPRSPAAAFYLLPMRGWELMAGASLAVGLITVPQRLKGIAGVVGLICIVASALLISGDDPFPGWRALFPVVGASLVIGAGPGGPAAGVLAVRPFVYLGRISYSLYLWHWPVFVFLRHWRADPALPPSASAVGILAAFILAAISYRFVEQPARRRSTGYGPVLLVCSAGAAVLVAAISAALIEPGLPQRLPPQVVAFDRMHEAYAPLARTCTDIDFDESLTRCRLGPPGAARVAIWGDSHAAAISEGVTKGLGAAAIILSRGGCAPAIGFTDPHLTGRDPQICRDFNRRVLAFIDAEPNISTVVLSAYWRSHERIGGRAFWDSVEAAIDQLRLHGKQVMIVAGIPDSRVDVPWASAIRYRFARAPLPRRCPRAAIPLQRVTIVDVSSGFCRYPPVRLFTDGNHISRFAGLAIVAPALSRLRLTH